MQDWREILLVSKSGPIGVHYILVWHLSEQPTYLIQSILNNNEHRSVWGAELPVQSLQAGAMVGRTVGQVPGVADRPRGKLLG